MVEAGSVGGCGADGGMMGNAPIVFPLAMRDVASLLVYSESVPSFSDGAVPPMNRPRGHALKARPHADARGSGSVPTPASTITAYRDFTEMVHAGFAVLNSAWGQFAVLEAIKKGPGTRAAFETDVPSMMVRSEQPLGDRVEEMSLARMILEAAPDSFGVPIKIHSLFPCKTYKYGRP